MSDQQQQKQQRQQQQQGEHSDNDHAEERTNIRQPLFSLVAPRLSL